MQIEELLTYLNGVKPLSGKDHYKALCPCHNDHEPSLDIKYGNKGILLACPVCGANGKNVMQALGLNVSKLFFDSISPKSKTQKPQSIDYIYSDTLKKSRFYIWDRKKQAYKKCFCWWHKADDEWIKGLPKAENGKSIAPPLYKDFSISATRTEGKILYIVEGEKDVDTLTNKLSLSAVCSPHGASTSQNMANKWDNSYNKQFKGCDVAIISDNDEAGHTLASYIAEQLLPYAKSVKIIDLCDEWENLKPKGDITDVYESEQPRNGKTVAETVRFKLEVLTDITRPFDKASVKNTPNSEPKQVTYAPLWAYADTQGEWKVDEKLYITEFVKTQGVRCINNQLYSVDGCMNDGKAKQIIIRDIMGYVKTNHGDKSEKLLKGIKAYCYCEPPKPSLDKIHFQNGTLSRDKNGLFTVWSDQKEFCINRIDTSYNPSAPKPTRFLNYIDSVFYSDDARTIQQYCGYCLIPTTMLQKALFIIGDGGEGKSVLGTILNSVIGKGNCYNESINAIEKPFGIANLENKLLFIDDDLSENALKNSRQFKNLVTNKNTIQADKKFVQSNVFQSYVRFLVFGNFTLQSLYDTSQGFSRRQLVLRAKPKDEKRVDNPLLDVEITENESEGVLLWLVNGLNELIKSNYTIFVSERTQTESDRIKKESDSVECFLEECDGIVIEPKCQIHSDKLYDIYYDFCDDNVLTKLSSKTFVSSLKAKGKRLGINYNTNVWMNGKRGRGFNGIGCGVKLENE